MIIIGRVKTGVNVKAVNLNRLFKQFGGGGHAKAASATIRLEDESHAGDRNRKDFDSRHNFCFPPGKVMDKLAKVDSAFSVTCNEYACSFSDNHNHDIELFQLPNDSTWIQRLLESLDITQAKFIAVPEK
jgi:hypothetical protein